MERVRGEREAHVDYFVLYVSHDVDGTEVEIPAGPGEAG